MLSPQSKSTFRILDIDLENRPLTYMGMDFTSAEMTAIAWSWVGSEEVAVFLLDKEGMFQDEWRRRWPAPLALAHVREVICQAGIVTGHYLRKHDLPIINSALIENDLPPLPDLLVQDTKCDMVRKKDLSASQESLAATFGLATGKEHMNQTQWREANRLTGAGLAETRRRVAGDVIQHKNLRLEMLKRKLLKPPRIWKS